MSVVVRHNDALELNLVDYQGAVSVAELSALAAFMARHPTYLARDTLNIIHSGCTFSSVSPRDLDRLFAQYAKLYAPLALQIMRRSAWVCRSAGARAHLDHWLSGDARQAMSSTVRAFDLLHDAGDWLLLSDAEIASADRGEGFVEIARFAAPAPQTPSP